MRKKNGNRIIPTPGFENVEDILKIEKISLAKCKEILCSKGAKYTDEQITKIRDFMYLLIGITFDEFSNRKNKAIIIPFTEKINTTEYEESYYLRAS